VSAPQKQYTRQCRRVAAFRFDARCVAREPGLYPPGSVLRTTAATVFRTTERTRCAHQRRHNVARGFAPCCARSLRERRTTAGKTSNARQACRGSYPPGLARAAFSPRHVSCHLRQSQSRVKATTDGNSLCQQSAKETTFYAISVDTGFTVSLTLTFSCLAMFPTTTFLVGFKSYQKSTQICSLRRSGK
jgi:hypothetical protein